ncbi:hypothetical protein BJ742DRAFT_12375 [Cladochytrium replicatum]|nr:hypothetical protein BJ742DRAFT_12375 [Cladochytrium replicatum]
MFKFIYEGYVYGPFESTDLTLSVVFDVLGIPPNAFTAFRRVGLPRLPDPPKDHNLKPNAKSKLGSISPGLYELDVLASDTDRNEYHGSYIIRNERYENEDAKIKNENQKHAFESPKALHSTIDRGNSDLSKPMTDQSKMNNVLATIEAMTALISSIPKRYFKYNVALSRQLNNSIEEVMHLEEKLLEAHAKNSKKENQNDFDAEFKIGTKIVNILTNLWFRVWQRYSPRGRVLNLSSPMHVSDVATPAAIDRAETYLNSFHTWRRILESEQAVHKAMLRASDSRAEMYGTYCRRMAYTKIPETTRSVTADQYVNPALVSRRSRYAPAFMHLSGVWNANEFSHEEIIPEQFIQETAFRVCRFSFIDEMAKGSDFSDERLEQLLREVIDHKFKEHLSDTNVYHTDAVENYIFKHGALIKTKLRNIFKFSAGANNLSRGSENSTMIIKKPDEIGRSGTTQLTAESWRDVEKPNVPLAHKPKGLHVDTYTLSKSKGENNESESDIERTAISRNFPEQIRVKSAKDISESVLHVALRKKPKPEQAQQGGRHLRKSLRSGCFDSAPDKTRRGSSISSIHTDASGNSGRSFRKRHIHRSLQNVGDNEDEKSSSSYSSGRSESVQSNLSYKKSVLHSRSISGLGTDSESSRKQSIANMYSLSENDKRDSPHCETSSCSLISDLSGKQQMHWRSSSSIESLASSS